MNLSQKLNELRELINEEICFSGPMSRGFNECIEHAERLERKSDSYDKLESKLASFYSEDEADNDADLLDIGEAAASHFGFL